MRPFLRSLLNERNAARLRLLSSRDPRGNRRIYRKHAAPEDQGRMAQDRLCTARHMVGIQNDDCMKKAQNARKSKPSIPRGKDKGWISSYQSCQAQPWRHSSQFSRGSGSEAEDCL